MDRSPESIAVASRRAASAGHAAQISFAVDELDHFLDTHTNEAPFDAVIGRLVLMYQTDPVDTVRRLAKIVRMGGSVTFMEMMMPMFRSVREAPLFALSLWRIVMSLSRAGADIDMADGLRSVAPIAERFGIFSAAEVDVDTLADRLAAEATETRACLIPPPLMAAWARRI